MEKSLDRKSHAVTRSPKKKKLVAELNQLEKDTHHVIVHFGPTETFFVLCHRPQKFKGLTIQLNKLGYVVELVEEPWINMCVLEMCGHEIFRTDLNRFGFNMSFEMDPTARRAVDAVLDATEKLTRSGTYFAMWSEVDVLGENATRSSLAVEQAMSARNSDAAERSTNYYADVASYIPL